MEAVPKIVSWMKGVGIRWNAASPAFDLQKAVVCLLRCNKQCGVSRIALRSAYLVSTPTLGGIERLIHFIEEAGR